MRSLFTLVCVFSVSACGSGDDQPEVPDAHPRADVLLVDAAPPPTDAVPIDAPSPDASEGPAAYTNDLTLSPITPYVVKSIQAIYAHGASLAPKVFAKVGDSLTASTSFLTCFAGAGVDLDGMTSLQATLTDFLGGNADNTDPFQRVSEAAKDGASAPFALTGSPTPLAEEVTAISPHYAVIMFGTYDIVSGTIDTFENNLLTMVDTLSAQGVVPILSSIPPRLDTPDNSEAVPRFNEAVRGVAQGRQIPFMDLYKEVQPLPMSGLGPDFVLLDQASDGACSFTPADLMFGYNVRNLLTLESLDRARQSAESAMVWDPPQFETSAKGTIASPFIIGSLPYTDMQNTTKSSESSLNTYTGCMATQNESGPEYIYKLVLGQPTNIRAHVFCLSGVDIDVHLLDAPTEAGCIARGDKEVAESLPAGTYYLSLDSFVPAGGTAKAGEYLLTVTVDP